MELGDKLKQARLEAGLSQRQLCGDRITRNMLSQIENGSARPSMDTLRYLAGQLGKSLSYFLEGTEAVSPNQALMARIRSASPEQVLSLLEQYRGPDPDFDRERYLIEALACLELAKEAGDRTGLVRALLEQAAEAGSRTPYYTKELEQRRKLLLYGAMPELAGQLAQNMPFPEEILLLLAEGDLPEGGPLLDACKQKDARWHLLRGRVCMARQEYDAAVEYLLQAGQGGQVYRLLEECFRQKQDFENAYRYACLQREEDL